MMKIRRANERGSFNHGWLQTHHTFSFDEYHDPEYMGFRSLRVINEDFVAPGEGFPTHPHRDMEIVTYVLSGALEHKDSMGNGSIIRPREVQYMSAGKGVTHSEFNASKDEAVHLLQIWIRPRESDLGATPRYDQKAFATDDIRGKLRLVASPDGADGSIAIRQDARVYASVLDDDKQATHPLADDRQAWIQVARGRVEIEFEGEKQTLALGDGAALWRAATPKGTKSILVKGLSRGTELILFDLN